MKIFKRIVSLVIVLSVIISSLPMQEIFVKAEEIGRENDFFYTISNGEAIIDGYCGEETHIEVPSELGGYPTAGIDNGAFTGKDCIISIVLPDSVKYINGSAFGSMYNLTNIQLSENTKYIGEFAFTNCKSLTNITIPASVESIGRYAFYYCESLETVSFKDSDKSKLNTLEENVFEECTKLKSISLPNSVTSLGIGAFFRCGALESVSLSDDISIIQEETFWKCTNLKTVHLPQNLEEIRQYAFAYCESLKYIHIPDSVREMGSNIFQYCSSLSKVNLPKELENGGYTAFLYCTSLEEVEIPYGITKIPPEMFVWCSSLKSITLPDSITTIMPVAFAWCTQLQNVVIPNSVTTIQSGAFDGCQSLAKLEIPKTVTNIESLAIPENTVIYGYRDSAAQEYAEQNGNQFVELGVCYYVGEPEVVSNDTISFHVYDEDAFLSWETAVESWKGGIHSKLTGVNVNYGDYNVSLEETKIEIDYQNITSKVYFEAGIYRTYIIPEEVMSSWKANGKASADVYMKKDETQKSFYVSTVFGKTVSEKNDSEYINLKTEKLQVLQGEKYDVIVSSVGADDGSIYYISQDATHQLTSPTGKFLSEELYNKLQTNRKTYVYVKRSDGLMTEPIEIKIEKHELNEEAKSVLGIKSFSLFDSGSKIAIDKSVPLIGGAEITTNCWKLPIGCHIEENKIKLSFGVDLFKKGDSLNDEITWEDFKKTIDVFQQLDEKADKQHKKIAAYEKLKSQVGVTSIIESKNDFVVNALGYAEAQITESGIVFTEVRGSVAVKFVFEYSQQSAVWVVPTYYYVNAELETVLGYDCIRLVPNKEVPYDFNAMLEVTPSIQLGGGAGIKGVASAGISGKASLPFENNFYTRYRKVDLNIDVKAEAEFFVLSGEKSLLKGTLNIYDGYYDKNSYISRYSKIVKQKKESIQNVLENSTKVSLMSRDYLKNTSEWKGSEGTVYNEKETAQVSPTNTVAKVNATAKAKPVTAVGEVSDEGISITDLQTTVFKDSQCQLVAFGDKMMMAWIEDAEDRDAYNRMRLVYSVCDSNDMIWSEPKAVYDSGHLDSAPSLASDGTNVYVAWQNIDTEISDADNSTINTILENSEIMFAKYSSETDKFVEMQKLTEDNAYDYIL